MRRIENTGRILGAFVIAMLVAGCYLISGTFVVIEEFSFTSETGFYHYYVDVTGEKDWIDHKDDIDDIDLVGFELWITNNESTDVTFVAYLDEATSGPYTNYTDVHANAVRILDKITLPAGPGKQTHITYGGSFGYIMNVEVIKKLAKTGKFHFYGVSSGGTATGFIVDSAKVAVTFTAHGS